MTQAGEILENHTMVVRDGRIVDLLPSTAAAQRYAATVRVERADHLLLPGLVNARTHLGLGNRQAPRGPVPLPADALLRVAEMLKAGTTCFCSTGNSVDGVARMAAEQGLRALIGIPIVDSDDLTEALRLRDEYRGHPTITTALAPHAPSAISDITFGRIATLADEVDAGILLNLHESPVEIQESVTLHGRRPIERMHALGLLTPALTAAHMVHVSAADIELAQRGGIAVTLCPQSNLRSGFGAPPVAAWVQTGLRLSVGSGGASDGAMDAADAGARGEANSTGAASIAAASIGPARVEESAPSLDLWSDLRLLALLSRVPDAGAAALRAWDVLALATRGGAAALGLETEIGTLENGKWADLCCVDLRHPAMQRAATGGRAAQLIFNGSRDLVSDAWVAGRHLLNDGVFTRLDWRAVAARQNTRSG